jgi:poly(3-hydroxybutyrate) depolymerase
VPCEANERPFITACGYDQAHDVLQHIYGDLKPASEALGGRFVEFSQAEFVPGGKLAENGLYETGYVYVPAGCEPDGDAKCALHVSLHGCAQSAEVIGDEFYKSIGLNEWGDSNNIIVLYPQARSISAQDFPIKHGSDLMESNPEGCWNWFGYGYDDRYLLKSGVQMTALHSMIRRVLGKN